MPSFGDSAFLVVLALLLFGPKKLPVLARQLGKLMADFRRASNEFRSQMEEELRISEQADRQKEIARLEATAAKPAAESNSEAAQPHTPPPPPSFTSSSESGYPEPDSSDYSDAESPGYPEPESSSSTSESDTTPAPIATSGDLSIMPPATGLPVANSSASPAAPASTEPPAVPAHETELETETLHG